MADTIKQLGVRQNDGSYKMTDIGVKFENIEGIDSKPEEEFENKFLAADGSWKTIEGSGIYENKPAAQGGTDVSLVTTGEKDIWNKKQDALTLPLSIANGGTGNSDGYIRTGQKAGTTIGTRATAEGEANTAFGESSHVEGVDNLASGLGCHAEGHHTTTSGDFSHTEGEFTTASGDYSHVEGLESVAAGDYSHAGGEGTIAGYTNQTVIGQYNDNKSTTLFEVGNGASTLTTVRSNAFEVHSNGNAVVSGDLSVSGNITGNSTFTEASTRANIASSESIATLFGKIKKWFTDLGTAAFKNVPSSGDAATSEVVMGNDTRLSDARNAADVSAWAKADTKPSYTYSEIIDKPSIDTAPTSGSLNLITSGAVYDAISGGGGGGGGHVIQNASGTALTQRPNLQFVGASVTDNASTSATVVEINPADSLTTQQLQDIKNAFVISQPQPFPPYCTIGVGGGYAPIGSIIAYMGFTAPEDYLVCNGATYNISAYKQLADFIKSQFGVYNYFGGDGSTTFAVPDLRGEFLRGAGTNAHTAQGSGANVGTHQDATSIPYMRNLGESHTLIQVRDNDVAVEPSNMDTSVAGPYYGNLEMSERNQEGFDLPSSYSARPTNTSVLYCIKARATGGSDYSTDEKSVGVWVDGKPLYQKTIIDTLPNSASDLKYIPIGASLDFGMVVSASVIDKNGLIIPIPSSNPTEVSQITRAAVAVSSFSSSPNTLQLRTSNTYILNRTVVVTIQYTKTTD